MSGVGRKRAYSQKEVANKKACLATQIQDTVAVGEAVQQAKDIDAILKELRANPHKIKPCRAPVKGNLFDPANPTASKNLWHDTQSHLYRLPKRHMESLAEQMCPELAGVMGVLKQTDSAIGHKLVYRGCMVTPNSPTPHRNRADSERVFLERYVKSGRPLHNLQITGDGSVDWLEYGYFEPLPEKDPQAVGAHRYTTVCFMGHTTVNLPTQYHIDET